MKPEEIAKHNDRAEHSAEKTYLITVNDTAVRIRFSGRKKLTACLADALNRMTG